MTENNEEISSLYIHLYFDEDVSAGVVVSRLLALLDAVTAEEMQNQLRYI